MTRRWGTGAVPDLSGKVALVTGANSGLGLATAQALAAAGAEVVLTCRSVSKGQEAMARVRATVPDARLECLDLDLSALASVRKAAESFLARHPRLDILCNNAGVLGVPYEKTRDGFERVFGTNHLGHFALTGLLEPAWHRTPGARIVTVTSVTHRSGQLPLDDLHWERRAYSKAGAYAQSKLANLSFALELDRRLRHTGLDVCSVAAHPGYSATNIVYGGSSGQGGWSGRLWAWLAGLGNMLIAQPAERGALPQLFAATAPEVQGGGFYGPDGLFEFRGYPTAVEASPRARDPVLAARLWELSETFTGVEYL